MSGIPNIWVLAGLLDISELLRGVTYTKADASEESFTGSIPVLRANNIQDRSFIFKELVHVPHTLVSDAQRLRRGDVVVATSSGSISVVGKAAQAKTDLQLGFGAFCGLLRPSSEIDARYFGYYFSSDEYRSTVSSMARGVNINNLKRGHFESLNLPLPPLNEQKRIADKLDALLARVDACRERLDRIPAILKRFRQAVLAAATSGKLMEDWRKINQRDMRQWTQLTIGQIISGIEAGLNVQCIERPPEVSEQGIVKISAVTWGRYNDAESKTLPPGKNAPEATRIRTGDFLISRANTIELVGACVIVDKVLRPVFLSDKILRLVMPDHLKPWLLYTLRSPAGRQQIETLASGNQLSMRNLSQANLRNISIQMPPDDEREGIVRCVEALFAYADRLEARYTAARAQVEKLTPALLAKAFRGELVPQDPNDEPASVLLERIRIKRNDSATSKSKLGQKATCSWAND